MIKNKFSANKIQSFIMFLMGVLMFASCSEKEAVLKTCQVKGRWISTMYPNTLYEYTDSLIYTIYDTDGAFGTIKDAIPNPNKWWMKGDSIMIDLNFGNIQKAKAVFKCDCNVMELQQSNSVPVRFHKEGFDPKTCP